MTDKTCGTCAHFADRRGMRASDYPRVCANCKWWVPTCEQGHAYSEDGECHRYPPSAIDACTSCYPTTECDDLCGEFAIMQHPRIAAAPSEEFANLLADDATDNYWDATEGNARRPLLKLAAMARMRPDGIWDGD